jgi:hypothetical protein
MRCGVRRMKRRGSMQKGEEEKAEGKSKKKRKDLLLT